MNLRMLRRSFAVAMACSAVSTSAWAQSASVFIGTDAFSRQCQYSPGFYSSVVVVLAAAAGPVGTARFKVVASSPVSFFNTPPNQEYDLTFSPNCFQNGVLASFAVLVPAGPAVTFSMVPATGDTSIEITDCDGYAMIAAFHCDLSQQVAPYRPSPPNGATNVPINQLLSYVGEASHVAIGTSPNLDTVICQGESACVLPLDPGPLAPNTTYYWQAANPPVPQVYGGWSELFSFTTGDAPLAVESSTWGHVKAMYRE